MNCWRWYNIDIDLYTQGKGNGNLVHFIRSDYSEVSHLQIFFLYLTVWFKAVVTQSLHQVQPRDLFENSLGHFQNLIWVILLYQKCCFQPIC